VLPRAVVKVALGAHHKRQAAEVTDPADLRRTRYWARLEKLLEFPDTAAARHDDELPRVELPLVRPDHQESASAL